MEFKGTFLLMALVVATTVHGLSPLEEKLEQFLLIQSEEHDSKRMDQAVQDEDGVMQKLDGMFSNMQSEEDDTNEMYATTSNGTLESIMQELKLSTDKRFKRMSGCQTAGPYGGGGGEAFHELIHNCQAIIKQIVIHSGDVVDSIQATYQLPNNQLSFSSQRGGNGGVRHAIELNVDGGERIVAIFGSSGALVDSIGFFTNHGRVFGPYGKCGGSSFKVQACYLRGIFGRSGSLLDSVGFYCSSLN